MARMMGDIEDTLFEMATNSDTGDQGSYYIEAVREVRMKKREIQVRFENRFLDLYDCGIQQTRKSDADVITAPNPSLHKTSVVDINQTRQDQFEQRIDKLRSECRFALVELDKHVGDLLQIAPTEHFDNPLQPETLFNAFQESCRDIQLGTDIRQMLMDMFDKHVGSALQSIYSDFNTLLHTYDTDTCDYMLTLNNEAANKTANSSQSLEPHVSLSSLLVGHWIRERVLLPLLQDDLPQFTRNFVLTSWSMVMERIYEKQGDQCPEWTRAVQIVTDLQACVQAGGDRDKRRQQIWMLPGLIYRLKKGMKSATIPLKLQADFLSQLKAHHARITESGLAVGSSR